MRTCAHVAFEARPEGGRKPKCRHVVSNPQCGHVFVRAILMIGGSHEISGGVLNEVA